MILLFLDDERNLEDVTWMIYPNFDVVIVVRDYISFCEEILCLLLVNYLSDIAISFDHDLAQDKSGKDCANMLINLIMDRELDPNDLTYFVHSKNPVGKENIIGLIEGYTTFYNSELDR